MQTNPLTVDAAFVRWMHYLMVHLLSLYWQEKMVALFVGKIYE
jgi:hypothetical protein